MTGYGFTGPMTARGTVFDAKSAAAAADVTGARYRYGHRANWIGALLLALWRSL